MIKPDISESQVNNIYLGIGSNLGNRKLNIEKAKFLLIQNKVKLIKFSKYYETPSWPDPRNPKFLNVVLKVSYNHNPTDLLQICKFIEVKLGRKKNIKNSPRTCDIDMIDYYGKIINLDIITVPHPRAHLRNFVLYPLRDISPEWVHPLLNKKIEFLIKKLNLKLRNEITRLNESVIIE